ncbi:hypothetical protein ABZ923_32600 [Streptomyces sp. NPDC046881]|uniref:hypothetical protein n=1 Tax=Streptomyces sp. NPDC046881 TaxID=3155374 RepID=UPI0033D5D174
MAALRAADPGSQWFFHRREDGGEPVADLWFHSYDTVLADTVDRLGAGHGPDGSPSGWSSAAAPGVPAGLSGGSPAAGAPAVALASASSDLALAVLRDGVPTADAQRSLALLHLRTLAGLIPDGHRLGFLFLYWQAQATALSPGERIAVAQLADREIGERPWEPSGDFWPGEHAERAWRDYVRAAHALVAAESAAGGPVNYLLFRHARETHARLGVPAATEAFAARAVRAALRAAPAGPVRELQSA